MARLTRMNYCASSMRNMSEWYSTERSSRGHCTCPLCGKILLLRKNARGWRTIFPTHTPLVAPGVVTGGEGQR